MSNHWPRGTVQQGRSTSHHEGLVQQHQLCLSCRQRKRKTTGFSLIRRKEREKKKKKDYFPLYCQIPIGSSLPSKHERYIQLSITPKEYCSTAGDHKEAALKLMVQGKDLQGVQGVVGGMKYLRRCTSHTPYALRHSKFCAG